MSDYVPKRLRYYNGQFLLVDDFEDEQKYHINRQMLHGRMAHFWGVAEGLTVTHQSSAQAVEIAPGAALDGDGNLILLDAEASKSFKGVGAGTWYLVIQFGETQSDPAGAKYVPGNTRWDQTPLFVFRSAATLAPGDIVLAELTLAGATQSETLASLTETGRTYAGLRLNGPGENGFDLRPASDGTLVLERYLAGDTSMTQLVYVPPTGGVGIGAPPSFGTLLSVGPNHELTVSSAGAINGSSLTTTGSIAGASVGATGNIGAATISLGGAPVPTGSVVLALGSGGALQIDNAGRIVQSGSITTTNAFISAGTGALSGGSLNVGTGASASVTAGVLNVGVSGQFRVDNAGQITQAGSITTSNAPISAGTGSLSGGSLNVGTGSISGGSLNLGASASASVTAGLLNVGSTAQFKINNAGQITQSGSITTSNAAISAGTAALSGGSLSVGTGASASMVGGTLAVGSTGQLQINNAGQITASGSITTSNAAISAGTAALSGGSLSVGTGASASMVGGTLAVGSTGQLQINNAGQITASGSITTSNAAISAGTAALSGGSLSVGTGASASMVGGTLAVGSTGQLQINNAGQITASGSITTSNAAISAGTAALSGGSLSVGTGASASVTAGLINVGSTGQFKVDNTGQITQSGSITTSNAAISAGTAALSGGSLSVGTGASASVTAGLVNVGSTGQFKINNAGQITQSGSITTSNAAISAGTAALSGGSLNVGTGSISGGSVSVGSGALSGGSLNVGSGTATAGTFTFPALPGDNGPVITARTVPAGQDAKSERTELILFHSNDGTASSGEDLITLRAPAIRLQTYNDSTVADINNAGGSNDRLTISPDGNIASFRNFTMSRREVSTNPLVVERFSSTAILDANSMDTSNHFATPSDLSQVFTALNTGIIDNIQVNLAEFFGDSIGTLFIHEGNSTSGPLLATQAYNFPAGTAKVWRTITLTNKPFIKAGQTYTIRMDSVFWSCSSGGSPTMAFQVFVKKLTADGLFMNSFGQLGVQTAAPDQALSVNGNASKVGGGSWLVFSDARLKKDVTSFDDGLSVLSQIRPVKYKYNGKAGHPDDGTEYVGILGQDVEKIAPYMITHVDRKLEPEDAEPTRLLMYDGNALSYILVNALKEQQLMIEELRREIEALKRR
ncbi:MAG: tail fiber domain-containing protein [Minicystis sp.]